MPTEVKASVEYQEKIRFIGRATGGQEIIIDYPPPLGDDKGIRGGLELLLMSLAVCAGQGTMALLRRMHHSPDGLTVKARGLRRDEHPTLLTEIHLTFIFRGRNLDQKILQQAITMGETQYCPVWAMLKTTPITTAIVIEHQ